MSQFKRIFFKSSHWHGTANRLVPKFNCKFFNSSQAFCCSFFFIIRFCFITMECRRYVAYVWALNKLMLINCLVDELTPMCSFRRNEKKKWKKLGTKTNISGKIQNIHKTASHRIQSWIWMFFHCDHQKNCLFLSRLIVTISWPLQRTQLSHQYEFGS